MYQITQIWWKFHYWFVTWFAQKPISFLNSIFNGKYGSNRKWYHAKFSGVNKYKKLYDLNRKLTNYVRWYT